MPAWSPEIANEFVRLAAAENRALDQIQLQKLVYIAHGIYLASYGQPLTGDQPEAWAFGPVYRRLREALAPYGLDPITNQIRQRAFPEIQTQSCVESVKSGMDQVGRDVILLTYQEYGHYPGSALSALTRRGPTPWREVFAGGSGKFREIPHDLIRAQFVQLEAPARDDDP